MKFNKLESSPDFRKIQENILKFWEEDNTFKKSLEHKRKGEKVFYDGPPFPTGKPHHGTVLVSFIKDMVSRYHTMNGYSVPRTWGWDCHGLPVETQVEKVLKVTDKKEIENSIGIDKFNQECYNIVSNNNDSWSEYVKEMCRWVDYEHAYKTMDTPFMESVLWAFKELYNKGLIYQDYRVTPYCYRCETALSISDTRESDSTRPKQDTWAIAKFKTIEIINEKNVYFLAWTTTPWTLPSNMALAVNNTFEYAYVEVKKEVYIAGKNILTKFTNIFGENPNIVKTCKGEELVGKKYMPLTTYFENKKEEGAFKVISAEFVELDEGVGIVHIAPAFGEDADNKVIQMYMINELLGGKEIDEISTELFIHYQYCICSSDWFIAVDKDNQIIKYIMPNTPNKEKAIEELQNSLQELETYKNTNDIENINNGGYKR